jgi:hypothetical protein
MEGSLLSGRMVRGKEVKPDTVQFVSFFMHEVVGVFSCFHDFLDIVMDLLKALLSNGSINT